MSRTDITTEADISFLVDEFYRKVVADATIGFIFTEVLTFTWKKHIPVMCSFWSSVLLGSNSYAGNPMVKHIELDKKFPLSQIHFDKWLELWENTVNENFDGKNAREAISRAKNIAALMRHKIEKSRESGM